MMRLPACILPREGLTEGGPSFPLPLVVPSPRARGSKAGISPPVLDDLLWERGREDPDLIGTEGGDLSEPPRREGVVFY